MYAVHFPPLKNVHTYHITIMQCQYNGNKEGSFLYSLKVSLKKMQLAHEMMIIALVGVPQEKLRSSKLNYYSLWVHIGGGNVTKRSTRMSIYCL